MVSRGDVVRIPFRHREIFGVVADVVKITEEKRTLDIVSRDPLFSIDPHDLSRLEVTACELGQSVSSILNVAYDGLSPFPSKIPSLTLKTSDSPSITRQTTAIVKEVLEQLTHDRTFAVSIDDESSIVLAHALCKTMKNQIILLVPRERDAEMLSNILAPFAPVLLTGKTKPRERNAIIRAWRDGSVRILIGTRQTVLISPNSLDAILIYQSGCEDHDTKRRNPYLDNRRIAEGLAAAHQARLISCDPLPPISASLHIAKASNLPASPLIVDATHHGERSGFPLLTQTLLEAIKTALHSQKKVLLSLNRKGVAKRLECRDCGHVPFCGTCGNLPTVRLDDLLCESCGSEMWKPKTCPACQSIHIGLRSIGGKKIADDLAKTFPEARIGHVEKGQVNLDADIILATEYFWSSVQEPFRRYNLGLVGEILADIGFATGDYTSGERTARKIARLTNLAAQEHAVCIIQTVARDRLLSLLGTDHVTTLESAARQKYLLPPFGVIVTFDGAIKDELPEEIRTYVHERHEKLQVKITHQTLVHWQSLFPLLPDHIKILIER